MQPEQKSMPAKDSAGDLRAAVQSIVKDFGGDRTRLMDMALAVQHRFGYASEDSVRSIATELGIHPVEIEDMISFYAFLNLERQGRNRIRLSRTPISLMKGAAEVGQAFEDALGLKLGKTSPDNSFTLEWTSDIGMADHNLRCGDFFFYSA
jgi:[NiFe] hydrogenase diaphorase moiety large subunit